MPFPFAGSADVPGEQEGEFRVFGVTDTEMDIIFEALSSATARSILAAIYDSPATASELSERTNNSIQTVTYHLEALEEADLIQIAETQYSEKGTEMDVYAPPDEPVVVFVGTEERKSGLLDLLKGLVGATGILVLVSVWIFTTYAEGMLAGGGRSFIEVVILLPGLEFLFGGLFALTLTALWWIWSR